MKKKHLLIAGATTVLGILAYAGIKGSQLAKDSELIEANVFGRLHQLVRGTLIVSIDITMINPTASEFSFETPQIDIFAQRSKGTKVIIAKSNAPQKKILLLPKTSIRLRDVLGRDIFLEIPLSVAIEELGPQVFALLNGGNEIKLDVLVKSQGFVKILGLGISQPIEIVEQVTITKPNL